LLLMLTFGSFDGVAAELSQTVPQPPVCGGAT
jgi:hypothetical protein